MRTAPIARALVAAIVAVAALAACQNPFGSGDDLVLDVAQDRVAAGGIVDVSIRNTGSGDVKFGYCNFGLDRWIGGRWMRAWSVETCIDIGLGVPPGETRVVPLGIPAAIPDGMYRVSLRAGDGPYRSDAFEVVPGEPPSP